MKKYFFSWFKNKTHLFLLPVKRLVYSIMVVRQILVLFVLVRIQVDQLKKPLSLVAFLLLHLFINSIFLSKEKITQQYGGNYTCQICQQHGANTITGIFYTYRSKVNSYYIKSCIGRAL